VTQKILLNQIQGESDRVAGLDCCQEPGLITHAPQHETLKIMKV